VIETSARLLELLSLLESRPHWSGPELGARLEVGPRTVRRDVERLRRLGYPVEATPGVTGGYRLGVGASMPPLLLDEGEAVAVAVGLRTAAGGTVAGIEETSLRALAKLDRILPVHLRRRVRALKAFTIPLRGPGPTVDADVLATIAAACRDQEGLRFGYRARDGATTRRAVEPHRVVHLSGRWYLVAWDNGRDAWRSFRVVRIVTRLSPGPRFAERPPPDGDAAAFVSRSVATSGERWTAEIVLHAPIAQARKRVPPQHGSLTAIDADTCLLRAAENWLGALAIYVANIGFEFEVREPPELIEAVRELAGRFARAVG